MTDCVFCKIAAGQIPTEFLYRDEVVLAFRDISPQAPVHAIVIPRRHIPSLAQLKSKDLPLIGRMVGVANQLARAEGIADRGYRVAINCGPDGTQVVPHLHLHLVGGRQLSGRLG